MKIVRWAIAAVLTAALLYVASSNSRGRPEQITHTENGYTFDITTVPKGFEDGVARITVKIDGPLNDTLQTLIRYSKFDQDASTPRRKYEKKLLLPDSVAGVYYAEFSVGTRGDRFWYFFEIRDNVGGQRAMFLRPDGEPFVLKYVGEVPSWILTLHILLMFATVYFIVLGTIDAIELISRGSDPAPMTRAYLWAVVCTFVGGYPFGWAMNWYTFGTIWEGVPFGTDATDNKTQLLFVYLVFILLLGLARRRLYSPRALGIWGVTGLIVMLAIYLIPHSIQFTPGLTIAVCWSWIGFVALLYGLSWLRVLLPGRSGAKG